MTIWDILLATLSLACAGAMTYLLYGATRLWRGLWRGFAAAPLVLLLPWMASIALAKTSDPGARPLWTFEVLSWAMLAAVYLVTLITAKRIFAKNSGLNRQA